VGTTYGLIGYLFLGSNHHSESISKSTFYALDQLSLVLEV